MPPAYAPSAALALSFVVSIAAASGIDHQDHATHELPANFRVAPPLNDVVATMMRDSPTFRAQCLRLRDVARVRVTLTLQPSGTNGGKYCRAEGIIRRYQYGFIDATVRLRSLSHAAELIAHEVEHVLESLDGVRHNAASHRSSGEVWMVAEGRFESARAIDAGRRVATEMARGRSARVQRVNRADLLDDR